MECLYCYGKCASVYAAHQDIPKRCWCSKSCLQAFQAEKVSSLLEHRKKFMNEEEMLNPPLWVTRLYNIEVVFMRALLKGTTKKQLLQFKTILLDRCVDAIENSTDNDNLYKGMADATKLMMLNFDFWIDILGV